MVSLEDLKIGKWYQDHNRIFMPIKREEDVRIAQNFGRNPDFILNMVYLQPVEHMGNFNFGYTQWEAYIEEDRQYLYYVIGEDTIEIENIKKPVVFNKVFKALFDYKWQIFGSMNYLSPGDKRGIEELKDIINAVRGI